MSGEIEWAVVYSDGGNVRNPGPAAAAAVLTDLVHHRVVETSRAIGHATNNVAEYNGILLGICLARLVGARHLELKTDSELVAQQVARYWAIRDPELGRLHGIVEYMLDSFESWSIVHIPRASNARADWLCERITRPTSAKARRAAPSMALQPR